MTYNSRDNAYDRAIRADLRERLAAQLAEHAGHVGGDCCPARGALDNPGQYYPLDPRIPCGRCGREHLRSEYRSPGAGLVALPPCHPERSAERMD